MEGAPQRGAGRGAQGAARPATPRSALATCAAPFPQGVREAAMPAAGGARPRPSAARAAGRAPPGGDVRGAARPAAPSGSDADDDSDTPYESSDEEERAARHEWLQRSRPLSSKERAALAPEMDAERARAAASGVGAKVAQGSTSAERRAPAGAYELKRRIAFDLGGAEPLAGEYSPDGGIVAVACRDGSALAFNASSGAAVSAFSSAGAPAGTAATALAFVPGRSMCVVGNSAGELHCWHTTSRAAAQQQAEPLREEGSSPSALAFARLSGRAAFASVGTDGALRLYDAERFALRSRLHAGADSQQAGHSNRAFAVAFVGDGDAVCVTAGWDGRAVLWDARAGGAVASVHGVQVCGQALDGSRGEHAIIVGSWREQAALQEWDLRRGLATRTLTHAGARLYSLDASALGRDGVIATGGADVRIIEYETGDVLAWDGCVAPAPSENAAAGEGDERPPATHAVRMRPGAIATDELLICTAKEAYAAPIERG